MKRGVVRVDHPVVQKKIDKGLKLSVKEGALSSISANFSLSYFSPAALALNATAVQMGFLYAFISLLPSLVQLKAAGLIEKFSRKNIVLTGVMGKILTVSLFVTVGILHWMGVPHMVWAFIGAVSLHYIFNAIAYPAWFSWMGSIVPEERRGKYFSRRNRVIGFFGVVTMIIGAFILDGIKKMGGTYGDVVGFTLIGFGVLFVLSAMTRLWSWKMLREIYEPRIKIRKKDHFSLKNFLKHIRENSFGRFSLFVGALSFVVGISSPYWVVYMIRYLDFSYFWYMAIIVSEVSFQLVFLPLLGKFSDRFGNVKLMRTCSLAIALVPFLWIASVLIGGDLTTKIYLLVIPAIVGGFAWGGYNLALNNYIYDAVESRKRGFGLSYMNVLVGFGYFAGAIIGALLAWADVSFMNPMLFIFAVSGVGRLLVAVYGSKLLHEVRSVKRFSSQFWVHEFTPLQGVIKEVHNLEHLVEKVEHYIMPGEREELLEKKNS